MPRRQQSGFTVIELMVTVAVVAVLALIAVPSFNDLIEKSRLRGATDDMVALLNVARARAIKLQRDVNVSVSGTTTWCAGASSAGDPPSVAKQVPAATACDCTSAGACLVDGLPALVSSGDYKGVTISNVSSTGSGTSTGIKYVNAASGITFNSKFGSLDLGSLPTNPLVVVKSKSLKYSTQISISPLGQTSVCVPSSSPFVAGYPSC
jgi:type IV fimbrial biogenesis protein FimT